MTMIKPVDVTEDEQFCVDMNEISDLDCELVRLEDNTSTYLHFPEIGYSVHKETAAEGYAQTVIIDDADNKVLNLRTAKRVNEDGELDYEEWDHVLREVHEYAGVPANEPKF